MALILKIKILRLTGDPKVILSHTFKALFHVGIRAVEHTSTNTEHT